MLEPSPAERPPRERGPGILANSATNMAGQASLAILGALGSVLTARLLGAELVGVLAVTFILADFGRPLSSFTHIPSILEVHRGRDPEVVFDTSLAIKLGLSTLFTILMFVLSPTLEASFHLLPWTVLLASLVVLVGSFYEVGAARLESQNQMLWSNVILVTGAAVGFGAIVALWATGHLTVHTSILATIVANLTMSVGAVWRAHRPSFRRIDTKLGREMASYGLRILATALLTQSLLQTDTLLISNLIDDHNASAGVYAVVFNLAFVMVTASSAMGVALLAALSGLAGRGEDTRMGYQRGTLIALVVAAALGVTFVAGGRWILAIYGARFVNGYPALLVLSLFGIAAALSVPAATMLNIHGRAGTQTVISLAQLAVNVPLNVVLIRAWGITGASIATTSVFVVGTAASWIVVRRATGCWPFSREAFWEAAAFAKRRLGLVPASPR